MSTREPGDVDRHAALHGQGTAGLAKGNKYCLDKFADTKSCELSSPFNRTALWAKGEVSREVFGHAAYTGSGEGEERGSKTVYRHTSVA